MGCTIFLQPSNLSHQIYSFRFLTKWFHIRSVLHRWSMEWKMASKWSFPTPLLPYKHTNSFLIILLINDDEVSNDKIDLWLTWWEQATLCGWKQSLSWRSSVLFWPEESNKLMSICLAVCNMKSGTKRKRLTKNRTMPANLGNTTSAKLLDVRCHGAFFWRAILNLS